MATVEILLATYNGEKYIREQIDSILNQDYQDWIVRACDDASQDSTYEILKEYKNKYPEKFIIQRNEEGFGSAKLNFMNLIKNSECEYVMCCDQDDVWLPNKISLTLQTMKKNEEKGIPVLVHTDLKVVDENLGIKSESFFQYSKLNKEAGYRELLIQNSVTGCTMMLNRELVTLLNRDMNISKILMHDWLAALIAAAKGKICFVDEATILYRQHSVNSVGAKQYGLALFIEKAKNHNIRKSLVDTTVQAAEVAEWYRDELGTERYELTKQYSEVFGKNKFARVYFYIKNQVLKSAFSRKIWQILLG